MKLIVAADKNFGIGKDGAIPWRLRADLMYFKEKTLGHAVIMGRKTLESLPGGKPLKDRINIVLTRDETYAPDNVVVCHSIDEVLALPEAADAFVIGGESVYKAFLPYCTEALITKVDGVFDADTYMENLDLLANWKLTETSVRMEENGLGYCFAVYENTDIRQPMRTEIIDNIACVQLGWFADEFDADIKLSLLRSCGIVAFKRFSGSSAVAKLACGGSNLGVFIYVSSTQYAEAKAILEAPFDANELEGDEA